MNSLMRTCIIKPSLNH